MNNWKVDNVISIRVNLWNASLPSPCLQAPPPPPPPPLLVEWRCSKRSPRSRSLKWPSLTSRKLPNRVACNAWYVKSLQKPNSITCRWYIPDFRFNYQLSRLLFALGTVRIMTMTNMFPPWIVSYHPDFCNFLIVLNVCIRRNCWWSPRISCNQCSWIPPDDDQMIKDSSYADCLLYLWWLDYYCDSQ